MSLLLINRPCEEERLSWPCWLTDSGRFTHINGYPSAAGPVQTSESSLIKDRRSTTEPPYPTQPGGRGIVMDYPCAKFGDYSFSQFGFIVQTESHTEAYDRYIHASTEQNTKEEDLLQAVARLTHIL